MRSDEVWQSALRTSQSFSKTIFLHASVTCSWALGWLWMSRDEKSSTSPSSTWSGWRPGEGWSRTVTLTMLTYKRHHIFWHILTSCTTVALKGLQAGRESRHGKVWRPLSWRISIHKKDLLGRFKISKGHQRMPFDTIEIEDSHFFCKTRLISIFHSVHNYWLILMQYIYIIYIYISIWCK